MTRHWAIISEMHQACGIGLSSRSWSHLLGYSRAGRSDNVAVVTNQVNGPDTGLAIDDLSCHVWRW